MLFAKTAPNKKKRAGWWWKRTTRKEEDTSFQSLINGSHLYDDVNDDDDDDENIMGENKNAMPILFQAAQETRRVRGALRVCRRISVRETRRL